MKGKSGLTMWTSRVRALYGSEQELRAYCRVYGIAKRLGYRSARRLWEENPVIGGSVEPADLRIIRK